MFVVSNVIFVLVNILFLFYSEAAINDKYGPYYISVYNLTQCNGAKPRVKSNVALNLKNNNASQEILASFTVNDTLGPLGFRVKMSVKDHDGKFTTMVQTRIANGCDHFLMGPILKFLPLNISNNCYLHKNQRSISIGSADNLAHMWFGDHFFYGTYLCNIQMLTPTEQVLCITTHFNVVLKKK